jgi:hypothetical protein
MKIYFEMKIDKVCHHPLWFRRFIHSYSTNSDWPWKASARITGKRPRNKVDFVLLFRLFEGSRLLHACNEIIERKFISFLTSTFLFTEKYKT